MVVDTNGWRQRATYLTRLCWLALLSYFWHVTWRLTLLSVFETLYTKAQQELKEATTASNQIKMKRFSKTLRRSKRLKATHSSPSLSSYSQNNLTKSPRPLRKLLVLDLDETLIHSFTFMPERYDFKVEAQLFGRSHLFYVSKRPHCDYFLQKVAQWYDLAVFTASMKGYAEPVIDFLNTNGSLFKQRLYRKDCQTSTGDVYFKDLSIFDRPMSHVCLLDNSRTSFVASPDNGILISDWISDPKDECLLDLIPLLKVLAQVSDLQEVLAMRT